MGYSFELLESSEVKKKTVYDRQIQNLSDRIWVEISSLWLYIYKIYETLGILIRYILDIRFNMQSNKNVILNVNHSRVYWDFDGQEEKFQRPVNTKLLGQNLGRNFEVSIVYIKNIWNVRYIF